jgi:hypothetical protein
LSGVLIQPLAGRDQAKHSTYSLRPASEDLDADG